MKKLGLINIYIFACILLLIVAIIAAISSGRFSDEPTADTLKNEGTNSYCNFLLLGKDSTAGLCDVMILTSIDLQSGDTCVMQIPRDTYFKYTDGSYKKINGAPASLGNAAFAGELARALGINIDYYLSLDLDTVKKMVDAVSGIKINVPSDMDYDDPAQDLSIHLKAGEQILNGEAAVQFLRYRSGYVTGDLGRVDAQKLFLNAFVKRLGEIKNLSTLVSLFKLTCSGDTNINEQALVSIGTKCAKNKGGTLRYLTAPGKAVQTEQSGAWYYVLSERSMTEVLMAHFGLSSSEKDFDKDNKFVDNQNKSFYDIYNGRCEYRLYTADDLENNEININ